MLSISANDLKRNGVSGIERAFSQSKECSVMVDVRGKAKYVILMASEFNQFREYQLDQAILEAEHCILNGESSVIDDIDNYALALEKEIANDI